MNLRVWPLLSVITFVMVGLLLIAVSVPLIRRRVRPNGFYGLRVPATFTDEWVWYEANAAMGRDFVYLGCVVIAFSLGASGVIPPSSPWYSRLNAGVLLGGVILTATIGARRANRLLRTRRNLATSTD